MVDKCRGSRLLYDPAVHGPKDENKKATCPHCGRRFLIPLSIGSWKNGFPVHVPREPKRSSGGSLRLIRPTE